MNERFLQVKGTDIAGPDGKPVLLKGVALGGWMNMENFINGFPGVEHRLRMAFEEGIGKTKTNFFFSRMADHFFTGKDVEFIKSTGANTIRLSLNYRHFESDLKPFHCLEEGFNRLNQALGWCKENSLYAILDLHSVQGWQNPDWHCDNATNFSLFWQFPHFQKRFYKLWEQFALRYGDNPTIVGFDVMNEPATRGPYYSPNWDILNKVQKNVVKTIRKFDKNHIIFLEGDNCANSLDGLAKPFDENLAYSAHNYATACLEQSQYPGEFYGSYQNLGVQDESFKNSSGFQYAQKNKVPLWIGEFGAVFQNPNFTLSRLRAVDDQLTVLNNAGAHWTYWTYKDAGVMGWVTLNPDCEYLDRVRWSIDKKKVFDCDQWLQWYKYSYLKSMVENISDYISRIAKDTNQELPPNHRHILKQAMADYTSYALTPSYVQVFKGLNEEQIDDILKSFRLENCAVNQGLLDIVQKHCI